MRIFVTGADGMLGSNLVRVLLEREHEVSALILPSSTSATLDGLSISRHYGDILKPASFDHLLKDCGAVIHAAASTSIWPARSAFVRKVNVEGTRNVVESVLRNRVGRMIFIGSGSSVNAAGPVKGKYKYPGARFGLDYNDSKFEALNLVLDAVKTRGLPAIAVLPTFMIGPWDSLPGSGKMVLASARGKLKFYTGGGRNFVHTKDVAVAIANSLEMGEIGKCYIAGHANLTYRNFFSEASEIVGQPPPVMQVPDCLIKMVGLGGTLFGNLSGREPLISFPMARVSCETQFVSSEEAVRELQMPQTDIRTAIRDCYSWFVENGYLVQ
jgi:dihydroflavonol-4-reductase